MASRAVLIFFLVITIFAGRVMAEDHPEHVGSDAESESKAKDEMYSRIVNSRAFVKAADKIVSQSTNREALELLKNAYLMLQEGIVHYNSKQYTYSVEDLVEATQMATHAMILVSNEQDFEIRDVVMYEESLVTEKEDEDRKKSVIKKNMDETVTFIEIAERILKKFPDEGAIKKLSEAQEALAASRTALEERDYDECLQELNKSYKTATYAINEAYKARGINYVFSSWPDTGNREAIKGQPGHILPNK